MARAFLDNAHYEWQRTELITADAYALRRECLLANTALPFVINNPSGKNAMNKHQTNERETEEKDEQREFAGSSIDAQGQWKKGNRKHIRGKSQTRFQEARDEIRDVFRSR